MASRPSYAQLERMIEYMEEHPNMALGRMRCALGRYDNKLKWEELTNILNDIEGIQKTTKQWSRFWADKKYGLKRRQVAQRNAAAYRLRYGLEEEAPPLSSLDGRILLLLEGKKTDLPKPPAAKRAVSVELSKAGTARARAAAARARSIIAAQIADAVLRRSTRLWAHSVRTLERRRLVNIEEKRVQAETVQAIGWRKVARAIKRMAQAVESCGEIIAEAVMHRDIM